MLQKRWGKDRFLELQRKQEAVAARAQDYDDNADNGSVAPIYQFGEGVMTARNWNGRQTYCHTWLSYPGRPEPSQSLRGYELTKARG